MSRIKVELSLEETMLVKNLIVNLKEEFRERYTGYPQHVQKNPTQERRFLLASYSLADQGRLNEISHKLSDVLREQTRKTANG